MKPTAYSLLPLVFVSLATAQALAQSAEPEAPAPEAVDSDALAPVEKASGSYWRMMLQGGVLVPLGALEEVNQYSLAGAVRIGWTSRLGLGLDLAAEYSPLSRKSMDGVERAESHFVTAALMPRLTIGKKSVRVWLAAGGGLAYERTRVLSGMEVVDSANTYALAGIGAAGIELYPISGLGLAVVGTYNRTRGDLAYELVNVTAGLSFTFR